MSTYLLTWNPRKYHWERLQHDLATLHRRGYLDTNWSSGNRTHIDPGERVFLLRQGVEPKGIMASGQVTSHAYEDPSWDGSGRVARYVDVRLDALVDPEADGVLALSKLRTGRLAEVDWGTQSSGIAIGSAAADLLEELWQEFLAALERPAATLAEEVRHPHTYIEGATRRLSVNAYERDADARQACIEHYGTQCSVCGFDFEAAYGPLGRDYIHVHHVVPLSSIRRRYEVDPVADLRPVCANCHAMLHRPERVLEVDELRGLMRLPPSDGAAPVRHEASRRPSRCPVCGSASMARIVWGLVAPDDALREDLDAGRAVLGGCLVTGDDASWECTACGTPVFRRARDASR